MQKKKILTFVHSIAKALVSINTHAMYVCFKFKIFMAVTIST
jgi:hypothetical protein